MNATPAHVTAPVQARRRPMAPLAIWIFEAVAITALTLVMMVVNEFRHHPAEPAAISES